MPGANGPGVSRPQTKGKNNTPPVVLSVEKTIDFLVKVAADTGRLEIKDKDAPLIPNDKWHIGLITVSYELMKDLECFLKNRDLKGYDDALFLLVSMANNYAGPNGTLNPLFEKLSSMTGARTTEGQLLALQRMKPEDVIRGLEPEKTLGALLEAKARGLRIELVYQINGEGGDPGSTITVTTHPKEEILNGQFAPTPHEKFIAMASKLIQFVNDEKAVNNFLDMLEEDLTPTEAPAEKPGPQAPNGKIVGSVRPGDGSDSEFNDQVVGESLPVTFECVEPDTNQQ